jgi:toxin ParE1/3/4
MMAKINKRPIVIQDLIEQATYIAEDNLDASDRFLMAAEDTFNFLGTTPTIGNLSGFTHSSLVDVRQYAIKGFKSFLIFYRVTDDGIDILRVLHGSRDVKGMTYGNEDERALSMNLTPVHEQWRKETLQEGRSLVLRLLSRRIGKLPPEAISRVEALSLPKLEILGEALLDFTSSEDLMTWLQANP